MRTPSGSSPICASRFAEFGLELHPEKTRLIEFGRFAAERRERVGTGSLRPSSFWGSRIYARRTGAERFKLKRVTSKKKMRAKLKSVKTEMRRRMHHPIPEQGRWLASVLAGHYHYYAVPDNSEALARLPTTGHLALATGASAPQPAKPDHLGADATASPHDGYPNPASFTPGPPCASTPKPKGGAQCVRRARWDLCGGRLATGVPTGAPGMTSSSGVQVPCGGDDTNHKPRATASS